MRASWPNVGSSSTSTRGAVASAAATVSRRFSPPDSVYGFASASVSSRRRSSSSSTRRRRSRASRAERARADLELGAHGRREQLVLGILEHRADAGQQLARAPADRRPARAGGERRDAASAPDAGGSSPARVRPSVDLPAPLGPVIAERGAGPHLEVDAGRDRRAAAPARPTATARSAALSPGARPERGRKRGRDAGHPHSAAASAGPSRAQHGVGRAVRDHAPIAQHDHASDERQPHLDPVLDDDERRPPTRAGSRPHRARRERPPDRGSRSARRAARGRGASR